MFIDRLRRVAGPALIFTNSDGQNELHMAYAIFKTGGKQYRVNQGEVLDVEKLAVEVGSTQSFPEVLLVSDGVNVKGGADLAGTSVQAEVLGQVKGDKVVAYKYRRRKGYHRTVGHRRQLTRLKITSIPA
jgi:large subunit ribosomal protein L21